MRVNYVSSVSLITLRTHRRIIHSLLPGATVTQHQRPENQSRKQTRAFHTPDNREGASKSSSNRYERRKTRKYPPAINGLNPPDIADHITDQIAQCIYETFSHFHAVLDASSQLLVILAFLFLRAPVELCGSLINKSPRIIRRILIFHQLYYRIYV